MVGRKKRYALADSAQQIVGGFLLAGPFVVTAEVWELAANMSNVQGALAVVIVGAVVGVGLVAVQVVAIVQEVFNVELLLLRGFELVFHLVLGRIELLLFSPFFLVEPLFDEWIFFQFLLDSLLQVQRIQLQQLNVLDLLRR